jgi:ADP-heptose:LPS heptosyltransferase
MPKLPASIKNIAVFRALKLGDFLVATPALRALQAHFPGAHISYVGLPWMEELAQRYTYISEVIGFPGWPGLPEHPWQPDAAVSFLHTMQVRKFDLALQMHGNGAIANPLVALFGAKTTAGFASRAGYWPNRATFTEYPGEKPEVMRLLSLLAFLDIPPQGAQLDFPLHASDYAQCAALLQSKNITPPYAVIHPGAASSRPWPTKHFAAAADACAQHGLPVMLTGTKQEAAITVRVARQMRTPAIDLAGQTPLGVLGALIKNSTLLVSNDTGVAHLATATRTPSVIIFTTSEPARWAPLDTERHRPVLPGEATPRRVQQHIETILKGGA